MTEDVLQRLRDEAADWLASAEAEIHRLQDRAGVYRHVLSRIDAAIADAPINQATPETPAEAEPRREKRDIRGAVIEILTERGTPHSAPMLRTLVEQRIGDLTESALARSLSSLVGDGKVIEHDGVFSLPPNTAAVSRLGIGFLSGAEAAK